MSRVSLGLFIAAAATLAAGTANASCCGNCCGYGGYATSYAPSYAVVQPAPQIVAVPQPPVLMQVQQPPVVVQTVQPVVQQYVVDQGPVYAGPALTDYARPAYYAPRAVGAYPYVGGHRWYGYRRAAYRPYWHGRRHWHSGHHHHRHHGAPLRRYY